MGFSIFYSFSLPASATLPDVESKIGRLADKARDAARATSVKIGYYKILSPIDCAKAQAEMNGDFDFARTICRPTGASLSSPLGVVPEVALYFRMSGTTEGGVNIGLAKYKDGAAFQMIGEDCDTETPYDGRWYFWTFIDTFSADERAVLETVMQEAKRLGFGTAYRDESKR